MNRIQSVVLLLAVLAGMALSSCQKEVSFENGNGGPLGPAAWEFKEGASSFRGPVDTAYYSSTAGGTSLTLEGVSSDQQGDFYLEITGASIITGTYATPAVVFEYFSNGALLYSNDPQAAGKFTVTISKIDDKEVTGTFTGEVKDTAGNIKMITDGKFTAPLVPAPLASTCKLSNLASYELSNGDKIGAITSEFNAQNQVIKTQVIDSSSGGAVENEFNITYASSQINVGPNQYFKLDGGGRITEFHGRSDPSTDTSLEVVISYSYDANGYMSKASLALAAFPALAVVTYTYEWSGGNLAKVTIDYINNQKAVIVYEYDLTKEAKGFLAFHTNPEITLFQNVVNFGKNSANLPVKSTWTDYDMSNTVTGTYVAEFKNYVLDANSYVSSFDITGGQSVYGSDVKHVLAYKCF